MAELNLKQIVDKLNTEFTGEHRKLVFWYDDKGDFAEDIDGVELTNAKVYKLTKDNQFYTKYFLEKEDTSTNYLIYAPFPKPPVTENHLEDTMLYSKRFYADRASLLSVDLGIEEKYKPIIEKHIKFFGNKERLQRFYDLEIENFNEENILTGIMSAVCRTRTNSFDEVIRVLITEDNLTDNKYLEEFAKYDIEKEFWKLCEQQFGFSMDVPNLEKLVITMFVTYADRYIDAEMPKSWKKFISYKSGNIIAFLDNLMNNILYREKYDKLSQYVAECLNASEELSKYEVEAFVDCDSFACIDVLMIRWIVSRLRAEDCLAEIGGHSIFELCGIRAKMHFGSKYSFIYEMLDSAYWIVTNAQYEAPNGFKKIIDSYISGDCLIDNHYRVFYLNYDKLENTTEFEDLRDLVENIYTNEYLGELLPKWNEGLLEENALTCIPLQRNFFSKFVKSVNVKTVVIISDAMRYEVGRQLYTKMMDNPKCSAKLQVMLSVLPSYTRLGMEALLPHKTLELTDDFREVVDGKYATDLAVRQAVLQSYEPESKCVQFDDVKNLKGQELRDVFTGQSVVYVYHDQIDNTGEHEEDAVFEACEKAVDEIVKLIQKISTSGNTYRFIVTADHGFIYKRDKVTASDKIGGMSDSDRLVKRRYIVSKEPITEQGVCNIGLGYMLGNNDNKIISYSCSTNVFSTPGNAGLNYVHGGSSPQEMLVPVLDIKMDKGAVETRPAQIMLVSLVQKITNLITSLDFIQSDPVSDVVKSTTYRLYFISDNNEKISNENIYVADKRDEDVQKRLFRMRFTFKNKKYDKDRKYYLVAYDGSNEAEVFRHEVIMDLVF
mgnify:FL=1